MSSASSYANKGKMLCRLLFPSAILRWIVMVMLAIFLVALALTGFLQWEIAGAVALIACINLGLICAFTIPTQMVALASSRTAVYLATARGWLIFCLLLVSVFLALATVWGWNLMGLYHVSPLILLGVLLITSLLLQASVWICSYKPGAHLILLVFNLVMGDLIHWLELWNPLLIIFAVLISWMVFGWWWIRWRPIKYRVNPFFIGVAAQQKMGAEQRSSSWFYSGPAKSWLGSRLTGAPDGWVAFSKRFLPSLVLTPLGFIPGYFIMGEAWLTGFGQIFFLGGAAVLAPVLLSLYALNLGRLWLYTAGDRSEMFLLIQKRFWAAILPSTLIFLSIGFGLNLHWGPWYGAEAWLYFLLSLILLQLLSFHLFWWLYQRTHASFLWLNLVCGGLMLWWFLMSIATGFLIKLPVSWQDLSPLWIVIPELILLLLLYKPVRIGFARINFVRAGA